MSDSGHCGGRPVADEPILSVVRPSAGLAVICVRGRFGATALGACRRLMDDVLALGPTDVVLDLSQARCDVTSVSVLALMRRYTVRRGARFGLTASSRAARALLRRTRLADLFPLVDVVVGRAADPALDDTSRAAS